MLGNDFSINDAIICQAIAQPQAFDLEKRLLKTCNKQIMLYLATFLVDGTSVVKIIEGLVKLKALDEPFFDTVLNTLYAQNIILTNNISVIQTGILSGQLAILLEGANQVIMIDVKRYPSREIGEPDSEKVVRGSRDGFTESLGTNLALIRRRIKTPKLRIINYKIGELSKTDVCLLYIEGEAEDSIINDIRKRLENIQVDELVMSDKALEELLTRQKFSPYPIVRYTERPDTFAAQLYQGMFGIIVDTSSSAIVAPVTIFDHLQHAEEFRQTPISGSYLRLLRFMAIIISFLIIPIWFTLLEYNVHLPSFFQPFFDIEFERNTIFTQIIILEVGIELLRMASIHTPNTLATSMGLVAGIIIGDMAIDAGFFSAIVVLLGAASAIGTYITPSYELGLANKIVKIIILLLIYFFDVAGLVLGILGIIMYLAGLKSFGRPYLYPLIPFNFRLLVKQLFRLPYRNQP